jgi:hypothetical protein
MEYIFNQFEELQRPEQALLIWTVGAVLTFLIGLLLIKKGFWKESGSTCEDGEILTWQAGLFDVLYGAFLWPLIIPFELVLFFLKALSDHFFPLFTTSLNVSNRK